MPPLLCWNAGSALRDRNKLVEFLILVELAEIEERLVAQMRDLSMKLLLVVLI